MPFLASVSKRCVHTCCFERCGCAWAAVCLPGVIADGRDVNLMRAVFMLLQAKELVEGVPKVVKKEVSKADGEEMLEKLKAVGAEVALE